MQDRFRPVYRDLYRAFSDWPEGSVPFPFASFSRGAGEISASIDGVQERLRQNGLPPLREDAQLLLLTCFTQMVYAPLAIAAGGRLEAGGLNYGDDRLVVIIADDLWTIASSAARSNPEASSISAHSVLNVLPTVWDRMKAGASRIWEG